MYLLCWLLTCYWQVWGSDYPTAGGTGPGGQGNCDWKAMHGSHCVMTYVFSEPLNKADPWLSEWTEPIVMVDGRVDGVQPHGPGFDDLTHGPCMCVCCFISDGSIVQRGRTPKIKRETPGALQGKRQYARQLHAVIGQQETTPSTSRCGLPEMDRTGQLDSSPWGIYFRTYPYRL